MRIIHTPSVISGNPIGLSQAERELGLESTTISLQPHVFGYRPDITIAKSRLGREARRASVLKYVIENADVVHFNAGLSLTPHVIPDDMGSLTSRASTWALNLYARRFEMRDLKQIADAGIGIVVTFQGDDARQGSRLGRPLFVQEAGYYSERGDQFKARRIALWRQYAQHVYALNPDLLTVLPAGAEFLPYASVNPRTIGFRGTRAPGDIIRIAHAPTDLGNKGTRFVLAAIDRLKAQGVPIELDLIRGLPNHEALARYRQADLYIDQVLIGWFGSVSVEVMAMGVPAIAHLHPDDLARVPAGFAAELPILNTTHETIDQTILAAIDRLRTDHAGWQTAGRQFVERWNDPLAVARQVIPVYESALATARERAGRRARL